MLDLRRVDQRLPQIRIEICLHPDPAPERGTQQIANATHDLIEIDKHRFQRLLARECHQLAHQVATASGGLQDHRQTPCMLEFWVVAQPVMRDLGIAADRHQEIVEVDAQRLRVNQPTAAMVCAWRGSFPVWMPGGDDLEEEAA